MKYIVCNSEQAVYNRMYDELEKFIEDGAVFSFSDKIISSQFAKRMINEHVSGKYNYKHVIFLGHKEIAGINKEEDKSIYRSMKKNVYDKLGVQYNNLYYPQSMTKECVDNYKEILSDNPIDVALLFIDSSGYILNYNKISEENKNVHTYKVSAREKNEIRKRHDINVESDAIVSVGFDNIMAARNIFLVALGRDKKEHVAGIFNDEENDSVISYLKKHPNLIVFVDKEAGFKSEDEVAKIIKEKKRRAEQERQRKLKEETKTEV
ncbi:MAG: glucosamine-6-phosphate isomerase [Gemella sp.]|nr:glucosamine-6-phosphate isomerase [Gemella sp.]